MKKDHSKVESTEESQAAAEAQADTVTDATAAATEEPAKPEESASATGPTAAAKPDAAIELQEKLAKTEAERDSYKDQLLRALADFQNFRKRVESDKAAIKQIAKESFVMDLIAVLDNFERTMAAAGSGASTEVIVDGIKLVDRQFHQVLNSHGVQKIASVGETFDPELHEAIAVAETDEHPENTVIDEVSAGYRFESKVIRPARVRVSKPK